MKGRRVNDRLELDRFTTPGIADYDVSGKSVHSSLSDLSRQSPAGGVLSSFPPPMVRARVRRRRSQYVPPRVADDGSVETLGATARSLPVRLWSRSLPRKYVPCRSLKAAGHAALGSGGSLQRNEKSSTTPTPTGERPEELIRSFVFDQP